MNRNSNLILTFFCQSKKPIIISKIQSRNLIFLIKRSYQERRDICNRMANGRKIKEISQKAKKLNRLCRFFPTVASKYINIRLIRTGSTEKSFIVL